MDVHLSKIRLVIDVYHLTVVVFSRVIHQSDIRAN